MVGSPASRARASRHSGAPGRRARRRRRDEPPRTRSGRRRPPSLVRLGSRLVDRCPHIGASVASALGTRIGTTLPSTEATRGTWPIRQTVNDTPIVACHGSCVQSPDPYECAFRVQRRSRSDRSPAWPAGQLNESHGNHATAQQVSTHQHRQEGAILALSEAKGAGGGQPFLDRRPSETVGFCPAAIARPRARW